MFGRIATRIHNWRLRSIARRKLAQLDDRLLTDIGASRVAIGDFVAGHRD